MMTYLKLYTHDENDALVAKFSKKEVCDAIFQMKHNKAPSLDGFPAQFYQLFWMTWWPYIETFIVSISRCFASTLDL
jgi:hypothetical protein